MSFESRSLKANGSPPPPLESWSNAYTPAPLTPNVTFAQVLVIMGSSVPCTPVLLVGKWPLVTLHIIVWRPSVISVIDGDILTKSVTSESVGGATPQGMWLITAQSTHLPNQKLVTLMEELILTTATSTPLWMTTREVMHIKPGA